MIADHQAAVGGLSLNTYPRRFPSLWPVEKKEACFSVRDRGGRAFYFEPGRRAAAELPTHHQILSNI